MIFYFSGTGNSRWVAQCIGEQLNEPVYALADFSAENSLLTLQEGERLGFVFPVYSWGPPEVVLRFVNSLHVESKPEYVYFVCTCGDDTGKTGDVFGRAIEKKGWACKAGFSVTMPNTYVCLPGFDVDSPLLEEEKRNKAVRRVVGISENLKNYVSKFDCHEGGIPRIKTYLIRPLFERYMMSVRMFKASEECISCSKCEKVCPLHNIRMKEGKPEWGNHCAMCLACYHHCPKHAVAYGNQTKKKGQYVFSASDSKTRF